MLTAGAITGDNGLPFIAIPEYAGPFWSGRALGAQHTAERLVFAAAPPLFGALITAVGYPLTFAVCGLFPLAALPFVPVSTARADGGRDTFQAAARREQQPGAKEPEECSVSDAAKSPRPALP
jgi:hypothetical protein